MLHPAGCREDPDTTISPPCQQPSALTKCWHACGSSWACCARWPLRWRCTSACGGCRCGRWVGGGGGCATLLLPITELQRHLAQCSAAGADTSAAPPATLTQRVDLELPPGLAPLQRFAAGMHAAFSAADAPAPQQQPVVAHVGVGAAGWGCEGDASAFRGCKWVLHAAVVLLVPDHAAHQQQALEDAPAAPAVASPTPVPPATQQHAAAAAAASAAAAPPPTPVHLFRAHTQQLGAAGEQAPALQGLRRMDWGAYGFSLSADSSSATTASSSAAPLGFTLRCVQPRSGARLAAVVLHLAPSEAAGAAGTAPLPRLLPSVEARLARAAAERAMSTLRMVCPAVVASRRDRCHMRALPCIAHSITGASWLGGAGRALCSSHIAPPPPPPPLLRHPAILTASEEAGRGLLAHTCYALGWEDEPGAVEARLGVLLHGVVQGALCESARGTGLALPASQQHASEGGGGADSQ